MRSTSSPILLAIAGLSGSGKSTHARRIARILGAPLFEQDTTLIERDKRAGQHVLDKFDVRRANAILARLLDGQACTYDGYNHGTLRRHLVITLEPAPVVIVEGILAFLLEAVQTHPRCLKLWIDVPLAVAEARQLARWEKEHWPPLPSREAVVAWVESKRVVEVPTVLSTRREAHLIVDNSDPLAVADVTSVLNQPRIV